MSKLTCAALVVVLLGGLVIFLAVVGRATSPADQLYPFTLPYLGQCIASCVVAALGLLLRRHRALCLALSSLLLAMLVGPWLYALEHWPGGDDGGGFAWMIYVGIASAVGFFVGGIAFAVGVMDLILNKLAQD